MVIQTYMDDLESSKTSKTTTSSRSEAKTGRVIGKISNKGYFVIRYDDGFSICKAKKRLNVGDLVEFIEEEDDEATFFVIGRVIDVKSQPDLANMNKSEALKAIRDYLGLKDRHFTKSSKNEDLYTGFNSSGVFSLLEGVICNDV